MYVYMWSKLFLSMGLSVQWGNEMVPLNNVLGIWFLGWLVDYLYICLFSMLVISQLVK